MDMFCPVSHVGVFIIHLVCWNFTMPDSFADYDAMEHLVPTYLPWFQLHFTDLLGFHASSSSFKSPFKSLDTLLKNARNQVGPPTKDIMCLELKQRSFDCSCVDKTWETKMNAMINIIPPKRCRWDQQKINVAQGGGPSTNGAQQYFATWFGQVPREVAGGMVEWWPCWLPWAV